MNIKDVVNDPEWQALRGSMVGTWMKGAKANVARLRIYLDDFGDPLRVRRVHNYLTGTAFRTRRIAHPSIDKLLVKLRARKQ